jgi:hypothetical protein
VGVFTRGQFFSFFLIAIGIVFVVVAKLRPTFPKKHCTVILSRADGEGPPKHSRVRDQL